MKAKQQSNDSDQSPAIILVNNEALIKRLKLMLSTSFVLQKWKKLANASANRYYRLKELITTEEEYCKDLRTLREKIQIPLTNNKILSKTAAKSMFEDIESMIQLSEEMKSGLLQKLEHWDPLKTQIGLQMTKYCKFLLLYSNYFKNLSETQRKMKELSKLNPEIRQIEKSLSTQNKIVTIEDLIIKPLQRPLRYSLILKDYCSKLSQSHPDYLPVKKAINQYHKVNQHNNLQMQKKEKAHVLIDLDNKYGSIIKSEARQYVTQYKGLLFDFPVIVYVLSDMVILINQETDEESARVNLDKYSLLLLHNNYKSFQSGLFLYGQSICVFLRFQNDQTRDEVYFSLKEILKRISQNEFSRQKILSIRLNRKTPEQNQRLSNQEAQFVRPLVSTVVGYDLRAFSEQKKYLYFVIEFKPSPNESNHMYFPQQLSFVTWETLLGIQSFINRLYPNVLQTLPLNFLPKGFTIQTLEKKEATRFQLQSILIQLFLNSIFRSKTILQRIDIICKKLQICDAIWKHLSPLISHLCFCNYCISEKFYRSYDDYENQVNQRITKMDEDLKSDNKNTVKKFCEIRTINSQLMMAKLQLTKLEKASSTQRISWIKARIGFINHSLTNIIPISDKKISFKIWFYSIKGRAFVEIQTSPYSRVRQVVDQVGKILGFNLADYGLEVEMGSSNYLLYDDEIIGNIYQQYHESSSFLSSIYSLFTVDNYVQNFYLKKIWSLEPELQKACEIEKLIFEVQQVICRLKSEEIRLPSSQVLNVYGNYFAYLHYSELDTLTQGSIELKRQQFMYMLPSRFKDKKYLPIIYQHIKTIQSDKKFKKYHLLKNILTIVEMKPGWSCVMFRARTKSSYGKYVNWVQVGCNIQGIHIANVKMTGSKLVFRFQDHNWSHRVVGAELIIKATEKEYFFLGKNMWKVNQQFYFYQAYYRSFRQFRQAV